MNNNTDTIHINGTTTIIIDNNHINNHNNDDHNHHRPSHLLNTLKESLSLAISPHASPKANLCPSETIVVISPFEETPMIGDSHTIGAVIFHNSESKDQSTILEEEEGWANKDSKFICRDCKVEVLSEVHYRNGFTSYSVSCIILLLCLLLAVFTAGISLLFVFLAIVPLVSRRWKDVVHVCENCSSKTTRYRRNICSTSYVATSEFV